MCNHKYNFIGKGSEILGCEWANYFSTTIHITVNYQDLVYKGLPLDTNGKCLFHSTNIEWKRKNNFFDRFVELFQCLNLLPSSSEIQFNECHFVGLEMIDEHEEDNTIYKFEITDTIIRKSITFCDSVFYDPIHIETCLFKNDITIETCTFKKDVDSFDNRFFGEIQIYGNVIFWGNLRFLFRNQVHGKFSVLNTEFKNLFDLDGTIFLNEIEIEDSNFSNSEQYVSFMCAFNKGLKIVHNIITCSFYVEDCVFRGDSLFEDNFHKKQFHLKNSTLEGKIEFVGTQANMFFQPNSKLDITDENFGENGYILFDYCNIINLGNVFLGNFKKLETLQLVTLRPSCKVVRFTKEFNFHISELNRHILEDFANFISRYYSCCYAENLSAEFFKNSDQNTFKVVFKTNDNIDEQELSFRLRNITRSFVEHQITPSSNPILNDLIRSFNGILERLSEHINCKYIDLHEASDILTLQNLIPSINLVVQIDKILGPVKIETQNIYGGNQQFADTIINASQGRLSSEDADWLKFVNEKANSDSQKTILIEAVETLRDGRKSNAEKETAKSLWKEFLEKGVGTAAEEVIKSLFSPTFWTLIH